MHDASEAYLVDLPHPLKHRSELGAPYRLAEARLEEAIRARFDLVSTWAPARAKREFLARFERLDAARR